MLFRRLLIAALSCVATTSSFAQEAELLTQSLDLNFGGFSDADDALTVSAELVAIDQSTAELRVTAELAAGYYIYSMNPDFGAATKISVTDTGGLKPVSSGFQPDHGPKVAYDEDLERDLEKFFGKVTWSQRLSATNGSLKAGMAVTGGLSGQYCSTGDGGLCVPVNPPRQFTATLTQLSGDDVTAAMANDSAGGQKSEVRIIPEMRGYDAGTAPIAFTISLSPTDAVVGDEVTLSVTANIERPWHTYSLTQDGDSGGGMPTEILLDEVAGLQAIGTDFSASEDPGIEEPIEGIVLETHYDHITWTRPFVLTDPTAVVHGTVIFQICNDGSCLAPTDFEFQVTMGKTSSTVATETEQVTPPAPLDTVSPESSEIAAVEDHNPAQQGLWAFLLTAVAAGYVALLTPCVFPMIPVTVSFFLKQGESGKDNTLKLAITYCLGIIGTFTVLGLLISAAFGGQALNQIANNPWLNLFFAVVFVFFALMLMGVFELRVPSSLLTWSAKRESAGGVIGALFMALTFTLVSFTCTFAFVGTLLALAAKGDFFWPVVGMLAFSAAFASPFFFLAMFPGLLKKLPKSGGWMNRVKVTLGLLELAVVAKFLSVADTGFSATQSPYYLDFSLVVGAWIAVSLVTGCYLLGMFTIGHDDGNRSAGPLQAVFALGFIGLGVYMSVGLFAPKEPSGILWQQIASIGPARIEFAADDEGYFVNHEGLKFSLEYDSAVAAASQRNKPLFVDFTGVNCPNCRLMEKVMARPEIHNVLEELPRAALYVDAVPGAIPDDERDRILSRNHELQKWYGDRTMPAYAIVSPDGKEILSRFRGVDNSGQKFQAFLEEGLDEWRQRSLKVGTQATTTSFTTVR